eukprot:1177189-Prorocentrum_minimum.AAC.1
MAWVAAVGAAPVRTRGDLPPQHNHARAHSDGVHLRGAPLRRRLPHAARLPQLRLQAQDPAARSPRGALRVPPSVGHR